MNIDNAIVRYRDYGKKLNIIARQVPSIKGNFISAIIGPRRAGKTYLMLQQKNALDLPDNNKIFINGEDIDFEGIKTDDLDKIEKSIFKIYNPDPDKDMYLFIDEIQNFPSWGRWLRTLFDEHRYHIIISGSTSELSTSNLPQELRGRAMNLLVLPFSFKEYCSAKDLDYQKYLDAPTSGKLLRYFSDFINFGGYPLVVASDTDDEKAIILRELYETVLQKDIVDKYKIRKIAILKAAINSMLGSSCRVISAAKLAEWFSEQGLKVSSQTTLNYLTYAQSVFLFFLLQRYSKKPKERNTKQKLYVPDSGLLEIASMDFSKKLENQVFVELLRRKQQISYYATQTNEVDFVIEEKGTVKELIQVSYSIKAQETYTRETGALIRASVDLRCDKLMILTFDEEREIKIRGKLIRVIPTWKWMLLHTDDK